MKFKRTYIVKNKKRENLKKYKLCYLKIKRTKMY